MTPLFEKIKLEPGEHILTIVRRHWFVLTLQLLALKFSALLPLVFLIALPLIDNAAPTLVWQPYLPHFFFLYCFWLLIHAMSIAYTWTEWYLDLWVITDRRIISIDQRRLFSRQVSSFRLERLQDLHVEINGFIATFLNYGDIKAQTASNSSEEFEARNLPDPRGLKALILQSSDDRMQSMRKNHPDQTSW